MNIHTDEDVSRFKKIDSDMLDANENYFLSTYFNDFNYRHLMSKIKMNKSAIADVNIYNHILSFFSPNSTFLAVHLN